MGHDYCNVKQIYKNSILRIESFVQVGVLVHPERRPLRGTVIFERSRFADLVEVERYGLRVEEIARVMKKPPYGITTGFAGAKGLVHCARVLFLFERNTLES